MKRLSLLAATVAALLVLPVAARDLAKTAGKQARVLLDNTQVRVIELTLPPGGHTGMHSHGNSLVYFLTAGESKQVTPDGGASLRTAKAGETLWIEPVTHDTFNVGTTPTRTLVIELKQPPKK